MSCQKGNTSRTRPQKHRNRTTFKNNLHDTSNRTKQINNTQICNVCIRCKEIIEWKIKYKKYKPLNQPRKCVKCEQKNVKQAYHVMCGECCKTLGVCPKCCQPKQLVPTTNSTEQFELNYEMENMVQSLPERKRRTFLRYFHRTEKENGNEEQKKSDLMHKLASLKVEEDDYCGDSSNSDN